MKTENSINDKQEQTVAFTPQTIAETASGADTLSTGPLRQEIETLLAQRAAEAAAQNPSVGLREYLTSKLPSGCSRETRYLFSVFEDSPSAVATRVINWLQIHPWGISGDYVNKLSNPTYALPIEPKNPQAFIPLLQQLAQIKTYSDYASIEAIPQHKDLAAAGVLPNDDSAGLVNKANLSRVIEIDTLVLELRKLANAAINGGGFDGLHSAILYARAAELSGGELTLQAFLATGALRKMAAIKLAVENPDAAISNQKLQTTFISHEDYTRLRNLILR